MEKNFSIFGEKLTDLNLVSSDVHTGSEHPVSESETGGYYETGIADQGLQSSVKWRKWTVFDDTGKYDAIAVASNKDGRLEVFVIDTNGKVKHRWQHISNVGHWSDWHDLTFKGKAKCLMVARNPDGRLELFVLDSNGVMYQKWQPKPNAGPWSDWLTGLKGEKGFIDFGVACNFDGRLEVFLIHSNGDVKNTWREDSGKWAFGSLDFNDGAKNLTAVENQDGRLEVFVLDRNGAVQHKWQTKPGLAPWSNRHKINADETGCTAIDVARNKDGRLEVFVLSSTGRMKAAWQSKPNEGPWTNWHSHDFTGAGKNLTVIQNTDGRLGAFTINRDGALLYTCQSMPNAGPWIIEGLQGPGLASIDIGINKNGRLDAFGLNTQKQIYTIRQTGDIEYGSNLSDRIKRMSLPERGYTEKSFAGKGYYDKKYTQATISIFNTPEVVVTEQKMIEVMGEYLGTPSTLDGALDLYKAVQAPNAVKQIIDTFPNLGEEAEVSITIDNETPYFAWATAHTKYNQIEQKEINWFLITSVHERHMLSKYDGSLKSRTLEQAMAHEIMHALAFGIHACGGPHFFIEGVAELPAGFMFANQYPTIADLREYTDGVGPKAAYTAYKAAQKCAKSKFNMNYDDVVVSAKSLAFGMDLIFADIKDRTHRGDQSIKDAVLKCTDLTIEQIETEFSSAGADIEKFWRKFRSACGTYGAGSLAAGNLSFSNKYVIGNKPLELYEYRNVKINYKPVGY